MLVVCFLSKESWAIGSLEQKRNNHKHKFALSYFPIFQNLSHILVICMKNCGMIPCLYSHEWYLLQDTQLDFYTIKGNKTLKSVFMCMLHRYRMAVKNKYLPNYFIRWVKAGRPGIGHFNIEIIFIYVGNSHQCLYNTCT